MTSAFRFTVPDDTKIRSNVSSGHPISVQDFLRGLKRPASSAAKNSNVGKIMPYVSGHQAISVQDFPSTLAKPASVANTARGSLDASRETSSVPKEPPSAEERAATPGVMAPPESFSDEISAEPDQTTRPSLLYERLEVLHQDAMNEDQETMRIPMVVRTYAKRTHSVSPRDDDSPPLFLAQSSTHGNNQLRNFSEVGSKAQEGLPARKANRTGVTKTYRHKNPPPEPDENAYRERIDTPGADGSTKSMSKTPIRRKRRAPVSQLPLVTRLPYNEGIPSRFEVSNIELFPPSNRWVASRC